MCPLVKLTSSLVPADKRYFVQTLQLGSLRTFDFDH